MKTIMTFYLHEELKYYIKSHCAMRKISASKYLCELAIKDLGIIDPSLPLYHEDWKKKSIDVNEREKYKDYKFVEEDPKEFEQLMGEAHELDKKNKFF